MATGGLAASSEWRPKATKVPQRVCSCSGYVHTHATTAALKCQLDVQLCAKNCLPPRGKKAHRFDMEAKGKKESAVCIRWHEDWREGFHQAGEIFSSFREETRRPNEWRHSVVFLPQRTWRTMKEKFVFSSSLSREGEASRSKIEEELRWNHRRLEFESKIVLRK